MRRKFPPPRLDSADGICTRGAQVKNSWRFSTAALGAQLARVTCLITAGVVRD